MNAVAVIGGGPWGLALAAAAARAKTRAILVSRRDVEVAPLGVELSRQPAEAIAQARVVILAVPSSAVVDVLRSLPSVGPDHVLIHGVRGLVGPSLETISDIAKKETGAVHVGALGGPAMAADLLSGSHTVVVCGTNGDETGFAFSRAFSTASLRVYTTNDLRGVEWSSALVACLGIVVGYAQRAGLSSGLFAATITRGMREVASLVSSAGGAAQTPLGLAGYGDLLAYVAPRDRPETRLGAALAQGMNIEKAASTVPMRVEAVELLPRVVAWARERKVRVPIFSAMADQVFRGAPVEEVVHGLMTLPVEDPG